MAIEVFGGTSIPRELATAAMEYLWAKWKTLNDTGSLTLERLTEECSHNLRDNSTHMMNDGDDFVYVYVGKDVQAASQANLAGTLLSQSDNPVRREFLEVYRHVARHMTPAFIRYTGTRSQTGRIWQRLVMPIRITGDSVMLVIYSELISHQLEVYEHLFRTAPDAMVIAAAIANDVGHTTDGWVVMMNDRARALLDVQGSIGNLRLTQIAKFAGIDLWGRLYAPKSAAAIAPLSTAEFDIELMRFPHVFGLRILPKTAQPTVTEATLVPGIDSASVQPA